MSDNKPFGVAFLILFMTPAIIIFVGTSLELIKEKKWFKLTLVSLFIILGICSAVLLIVRKI